MAPVFFDLYSHLSQEALDLDVRAWKMSPKFHLIAHLLLDQNILNPQYTWTYCDEDLQRILKQVASSCSPLNIPKMVLTKWVCGRFDD